MAIGRILEGTRINLRPVEVSDAEFTMKIRNDESLTEFIPKVPGTLETQKSWIARQREKEGDYFFIIENKDGKALGTLAYYDVVGSTCELGRYISYGNAYENVEAAVLLIEYLFDNGFTKIIFNNDQRNSRIIRFWKKFGVEYAEAVPMEGWTAAQYRLTPDLYSNNKEAIAKLIGVGRQN